MILVGWGMLTRVLVGVGVCLAVIAGVWGLHRFCIALEERGYLYYRKGPDHGGGGGGNVFTTLDQLTRPSMKHVVQTEDHTHHQQQSTADGKPPAP